MTSARNHVPTYHVVPRFDIAAMGGPLELGTVVDNLMMLRPLNRENIVPIPKKLRYVPVTYSGFTETSSQLREGHGGIWAKALVFQAGVSADGSAQNRTLRTVTCDAVITTYFDPDLAYVAQSLAARGVKEHFIASGYEDDVYLITGLKVAKRLRYGSSTSAQRTANVEAAADEPNTGTKLNAGLGASSNSEHKVEFDANDIVVGFRVRRYAYVPASRNPLSKKLKLKVEDYLENAEMYEAGTEEIKGPEATHKQVAIKEEQDAQKEAEVSGELGECWIDPTK